MAAWVTRAYLGIALLLVPWGVYLAISLPERAVSENYRLTWVGFDLFLVAAVARVAWLAARRDARIALGAIVVSTLLVVDAWFDVTTSAPGSARTTALLAAVLLEIPGALTSGLLAHRALHAAVALPPAAAGRPGHGQVGSGMEGP